MTIVCNCTWYNIADIFGTYIVENTLSISPSNVYLFSNIQEVATDGDTYNLLSYRIKPPQPNIIINEQSGDLSTKSLDREEKDTYYVQIVAYDDGMNIQK